VIETMTLPAVLGVLAPVLVAVITRAHWTGQVKRWTALGVYLVLGVLAWVITRFPTEGQVILAELSTVIAAGQVVYTALKPTGLIEQIEERTTPAGGGTGASD